MGRYAELLYPYINKETCPVNLEQLQDLMGMHAVALMLSIKSFFLENMSLEEAIPSYQRRMKLLRYGVCPRPDESKSN